MEEFLLLPLKMRGQNFCYVFYMHSVTMLRKKGFFNLPPAYMVSFSLFLQKIRYNSKLMQEKPDIPPGLRHHSVLGSAPLWKVLGCENVFNLLICFFLSSQFSFFFTTKCTEGMCMCVSFLHLFLSSIYLHYLFLLKIVQVTKFISMFKDEVIIS